MLKPYIVKGNKKNSILLNSLNANFRQYQIGSQLEGFRSAIYKSNHFFSALTAKGESLGLEDQTRGSLDFQCLCQAKQMFFKKYT